VIFICSGYGGTLASPTDVLVGTCSGGTDHCEWECAPGYVKKGNICCDNIYCNLISDCNTCQRSSCKGCCDWTCPASPSIGCCDMFGPSIGICPAPPPCTIDGGDCTVGNNSTCCSNCCHDILAQCGVYPPIDCDGLP